MISQLEKIRSHSEISMPIAKRIRNALFVLLLGGMLGFLAKYTDGSPIGLVGTYLGIWVFITTIVSIYSRSPFAAALHAFLFLFSMLIVYYLYSMYLFGFLPKYYLFAWGSIALLSPIGGFFVWYARGKGWFAAFCAALPISLLIVEGYNFYYTFSFTSGLDLLFAITLLFLLAKEWNQRLKIGAITLVVTIFLIRIGILYYLPA
ncbi:DUF6518 family protein [Bacillus sp. FJAT-45066]|uniref:DUF6518 family protein n=1 Tax=Bacillus sp. FJAT-45066 TaxID=2011010 RepID=UPI000BB6C147|nr:DUF6518 family protein [Bacillus sp. FJAT-45066]